ncbi:MAG: hypothetical protein AB1634_16350 [Thermodesulfobacteriota bacterium]
MRPLAGLIAVLAGVALAGQAQAGTITDWYGDDDGFGRGVLADDSFAWRDVIQEPDDAPGTDRFSSRIWTVPSWTHDLGWDGSGTLTGASLEIFSGGQGAYGPSEVLVNGLAIGSLTDGEIGGTNYARLDAFDLLPYIGLFGDSLTVSVRTAGSPCGWQDNWVLDYSRLTLSFETGPAHAVPLPASLVLLSSGLLAAAALRLVAVRA